MRWTIKQISEKTGVTADTLRYYEKVGIISPKRLQNGYRYYDDEDVLVLKYVCAMKYAHFSLSEIKNMTEMFKQSPSSQCNAVCKGMLNAKITELKQTVFNYQQIIGLMEKLMPMIDNIDLYLTNKQYIDDFIGRIFDDIQNDSLFLSKVPSNKEEC